MPFHYGDWDAPGRKGAANRLTLSGWDPVSKQPHFKYAAVKIRRLGQADAEGGAQAGYPASAPVEQALGERDLAGTRR
jgi:hypothetical protein